MFSILTEILIHYCSVFYDDEFGVVFSFCRAPLTQHLFVSPPSLETPKARLRLSKLMDGPPASRSTASTTTTVVVGFRAIFVQFNVISTAPSTSTPTVTLFVPSHSNLPSTPPAALIKPMDTGHRACDLPRAPPRHRRVHARTRRVDQL